MLSSKRLFRKNTEKIEKVDKEERLKEQDLFIKSQSDDHYMTYLGIDFSINPEYNSFYSYSSNWNSDDDSSHKLQENLDESDYALKITDFSLYAKNPYYMTTNELFSTNYSENMCFSDNNYKELNELPLREYNTNNAFNCILNSDLENSNYIQSNNTDSNIDDNSLLYDDNSEMSSNTNSSDQASLANNPDENHYQNNFEDDSESKTIRNKKAPTSCRYGELVRYLVSYILKTKVKLILEKRLKKKIFFPPNENFLKPLFLNQPSEENHKTNFNITIFTMLTSEAYFRFDTTNACKKLIKKNNKSMSNCVSNLDLINGLPFYDTQLLNCSIKSLFVNYLDTYKSIKSQLPKIMGTKHHLVKDSDIKKFLERSEFLNTATKK